MNRQFWKRFVYCGLLILFISWSSWLLIEVSPALASINNDKYEGNIFVLYAGNGSLVPPRLTLEQSLHRERPSVLVFYIDDSRDCKQFSIVVSRIQEYYGRAASIIPIDVDALPMQKNYSSEEAGYYYRGVVPQTVLLNQKGEVVFNAQGQVAFEAVDDVLREIFELLPRSESVQLKRRSVNEFSTELAE